MNYEDRHEFILEVLRKSGGAIRVEDLAKRAGVSGATIRSDLRLLESQHLIRRSHGLAAPVKQDVIDLPISEKYKINSEAKQAIGRKAASLLNDGDSIILTSGTTAEALAWAFPDDKNISALTSSIRIAGILSSKEKVRTVVLGGTLIRNSLSVRDDYSLAGLDNIHAGKMFFSCDGFDAESGITTAFPEEARLTCRMMECSLEHILLADSSKFGKIGFGKICPLNAIDLLVTDSGLSTAARERIELAGVKVIIA